MERTIPIDPILEKAYNVRLLVDDFDGLINTWIHRSVKFRSTVDTSLNCQYDEGEKNKLDIFRCGKPNAPLCIRAWWLLAKRRQIRLQFRSGVFCQIRD